MTTDTIKLKATFDNPDRRSGRASSRASSLRLATLDHATVVPSQAVQTGQDGQFVFVVKDDSTVEQRPVTIGQRVDDDVVVQKGLQAGRDGRDRRAAAARARLARDDRSVGRGGPAAAGVDAAAAADRGGTGRGGAQAASSGRGLPRGDSNGASGRQSRDRREPL